ncbi:unnamed protein product [Pleuronectes platessa]|uniref:Uncharacterized protein n=1 Tax=Pleuronectes platessa TaxID=8262 RepID=A0A9N7TZS0_PLEPL|nr:unnamed protein product [Pleuronectes platessa]
MEQQVGRRRRGLRRCRRRRLLRKNCHAVVVGGGLCSFKVSDREPPSAQHCFVGRASGYLELGEEADRSGQRDSGLVFQHEDSETRLRGRQGKPVGRTLLCGPPQKLMVLDANSHWFSQVTVTLPRSL